MTPRRTVVRRVLLVALVLAALHGGVTLGRALTGGARSPTPPATPAILPAAEGAVRALALQFHRPAAERFLPVFGQMLRALDPATAVHVVVADAEDRAAFEAARRTWFPGGGGPRVSYAETGQPITSWLRDRLAVCADERGRPTLLAPDAPMAGPTARVQDWLVPWTLGTHLGAAAVTARTDWRFDGGDLIADTTRAYVATPVFGRNPGLPADVLTARIAHSLGRPVCRIGTTGAVPNHHIGMFLTPLGNGRVAVGDPDAALAALEAAGGVPADGVISAGGGPLTLDLRPERLDRFRRVAAELRAAGCSVVAMPILPAVDDFVFCSYNNVLADRRADGLHVLMPTYGIPALDAAAARAWAALGATVHPIDCAGIFRLGGTVRCLCAPLVRG